MYSEQLWTRFMQPQFAGQLPAETPGLMQVQVGQYEQGAVLTLSLSIDPDKALVLAAAFSMYGCGACIATADLLCERIIGLNLEQLSQFQTQALATELALPNNKLHCIWLVSEALQQVVATNHTGSMTSSA